MSEEIPHGWIRLPLAEVATMRLGKMLDASRRDQGQQFPYLRNINVRWGEFDISTLFTMGFDKDELDEYGLLPGDVLVCEGGEPGRAAVWQLPQTDVKFQKAIHRVRLAGGIDPRWLMLHLKNDAISGRLELHFSGTTIKHFTGVTLAKYPFTIPPIPEQCRIVARIEVLQARSRKARESLVAVPRLLEQFRQSVLVAAFRGDLTADWRELHPDTEPATKLLGRIHRERRQKWEAANPRKKYAEPEPVADTDLPELPDSWCWASVNEIAEIRLGRQRSPDRAQGDYMRPYMRAANVTWDGISATDVKEMDFTPDEFKVYELQKGDILLGEASGSASEVGKPAIWNNEVPGACFQNTLIRVRTESALIQYLHRHFFHDALTGAFARASQGIGIYHLGRENIANWPIRLAPLAEQQEIANRIESHLAGIRKIAADVEGAIAELTSFDQSILAQAFRGELVEQDPADESATVLLDRIRASRNGTTKHAEPIAQPTTKLLATRYIVMLLRDLKLKVARPVLEACLVLMLNDDARRAILGKKSAAKAKKTKSNRTHIPGLDYLLGELVTAKFLAEPKVIKNAQVFGLDHNAPTDADIAVHATALDKQRLAETLQVIEVVGEERARLQLNTISHVKYELVPG